MSSHEEKQAKDHMTSLGLNMDDCEEESSASHTHQPVLGSPMERSSSSRDRAQLDERHRINLEFELRDQERRESEQNQRETELEDAERKLRRIKERERLQKAATTGEGEKLSESAQQMMMILKQLDASNRLDRMDEREAAREERTKERLDHAQDMEKLSKMNYQSLDESLSALRLNMTTHGPVSTKLKRVQPATFHGTAPENAEMWLKRFDVWSNMSGESSRDAKLMNFSILMKGTADAWLSRLPGLVRDNYDLLIERFLSFFDNSSYRNQIKEMLNTKVIAVEGDIEEYIGEMLMGAQMCDLDDENLKSVITRGLPDKLRGALMRVGNVSLAEFIQTVKVEFSVLRIGRGLPAGASYKIPTISQPSHKNATLKSLHMGPSRCDDSTTDSDSSDDDCDVPGPLKAIKAAPTSASIAQADQRRKKSKKRKELMRFASTPLAENLGLGNQMITLPQQMQTLQQLVPCNQQMVQQYQAPVQLQPQQQQQQMQVQQVQHVQQSAQQPTTLQQAQQYNQSQQGVQSANPNGNDYNGQQGFRTDSTPRTNAGNGGGRKNGLKNWKKPRQNNNDPEFGGADEARDMSRVECFFCGEKGHFSRNCKIRIECVANRKAYYAAEKNHYMSFPNMKEGDPFAGKNGPLAVDQAQTTQGQQAVTQQPTINVSNSPQQTQQYQAASQNGNSGNMNAIATGTSWEQSPAQDWGRFTQQQ
jgi:hypothetical protein